MIKIKAPPPDADLFKNPFAAGLCLSLVGMFLAFIGGYIWKSIKRNKK